MKIKQDEAYDCADAISLEKPSLIPATNHIFGTKVVSSYLFYMPKYPANGVHWTYKTAQPKIKIDQPPAK